MSAKRMNWSLDVIENWEFEVKKGEAPSFKVSWYYYVGSLLLSAVIGFGLSFGGMYLFGG